MTSSTARSRATEALGGRDLSKSVSRRLTETARAPQAKVRADGKCISKRQPERPETGSRCGQSIRLATYRSIPSNSAQDAGTQATSQRRGLIFKSSVPYWLDSPLVHQVQASRTSRSSDRHGSPRLRGALCFTACSIPSVELRRRQRLPRARSGHYRASMRRSEGV